MITRPGPFENELPAARTRITWLEGELENARRAENAARTAYLAAYQHKADLAGELRRAREWAESITPVPRCAQCTRRTSPDGRHLPEDGGEFACPRTTSDQED